MFTSLPPQVHPDPSTVRRFSVRGDLPQAEHENEPPFHTHQCAFSRDLMADQLLLHLHTLTVQRTNWKSHPTLCNPARGNNLSAGQHPRSQLFNQLGPLYLPLPLPSPSPATTPGRKRTRARGGRRRPLNRKQGLGPKDGLPPAPSRTRAKPPVRCVGPSASRAGARRASPGQPPWTCGLGRRGTPARGIRVPAAPRRLGPEHASGRGQIPRG